MRVWCGIDWAERHHDISLVDDQGTELTRRRISDDVAGFTELAGLLAEHGAQSEQPVPVAIETAKGLVCAALRAAGYQLYPINPLAVSRYRDRYAVSRAKSDPGDAYVLANILRTDPGAHRPLPDDSELAQEIRVLARAHQDAIWDRQQITNKLRSLLREYYPTFLATFPDLASREARATLALAPTPAAAARLRKAALRAALTRAGRRRGIDTETTRILAGLRGEQLRQPPRVEAAMGRQALGYQRALDTAAATIAELEQALTESFNQHPDAEIITSFPGLGTILGARVLAEIGDDRSRFQNAKGFKAYAGTAPVTRTSGKRRSVTRRLICNKRLCQAGYLWAFSLLTASAGARAHYDKRRENGDSFSSAGRHLANRYFGILYHCLQTRQAYDEAKAFPAIQTTTAAA
jgi:transposase